MKKRTGIFFICWHFCITFIPIFCLILALANRLVTFPRTNLSPRYQEQLDSVRLGPFAVGVFRVGFPLILVVGQDFLFFLGGVLGLFFVFWKVLEIMLDNLKQKMETTIVFLR